MFRSRGICLLFIAIVLFAVISGCASLPIAGPLPEGVSVKKLRHFDGSSPLAWHPTGDTFAFADDLLQLYDLQTGNTVPFVPATGLAALDWSPDGRKLAAAFREGDDSLLRIFDISGNVLAESKVRGDVTKLMWRSADEVLASAVLTKKFSFGTNFSGVLYRWKGTAAPTARVLNDTTIKKATAGIPKEALYHTFTFTVSPLGDEVVFTKLIDPPMFPAYIKIVMYNLETGAEHEAVTGEAAVSSGGAAFTADGERIIYGNGFDSTVQLDPWTGAKKNALPSPGRTIAVSPANLYLFLDGTLFRKDKAVASFPAMVKGAFSPHGDHLLLSFEKNIYLISGLKEPPVATLPPAVKERLLVLRKWRSEGLISPAEYEAAKGKLQQ